MPGADGDDRPYPGRVAAGLSLDKTCDETTWDKT